MIIRFFMSILALLFPWLILLIEDNPGGAVIALIMQATVIGWPFAAVWALRTVRASNKIKKRERLRAKLRAEEKKEEKERLKKEIKSVDTEE